MLQAGTLVAQLIHRIEVGGQVGPEVFRLKVVGLLCLLFYQPELVVLVERLPSVPGDTPVGVVRLTHVPGVCGLLEPAQLGLVVSVLHALVSKCKFLDLGGH